MATLTKGKTFTNGELVTPQKLHELVDLGTVSGIVNADISASAAIADSKLATISTAGKVSNSATTAASANTANAIVARDASGNFSAGTITAALAGNASTASKLATARTIALTGAVTGSTTFDGSGNASIATTHTADPKITLTGDVTGSGTMTNLGNVSITATVADDSHNHIISNIDGLQAALDGKQAAGSYAPATGIAPSAITGTAVITTDSRLSNARTPTAHTHDDRYYTETEIDAKLSSLPVSGHTHSAADITSGTLAIARIPTGTTSTTVALGNHTHSGYAASSHTHDDRYYTETEVNTLLAGKLGTTATAAAATKLATARTINGVAFNGTANITVTANPNSHTHGNITNAGAIGSTSGVPIITGTSGVLQAGSFGTTAGTYCQGNDSRLSNARTPTAHTHDDRYYTETEVNTLLAGKLGTTATAAAATKLATARTIALTGAVTGSTTFDGSGNASIATTHTADPKITLTGDVTGSGTMTNLGNVSITATVADDSHNHIISNIDGLQAALDGKQAAGSYVTNGGSVSSIQRVTAMPASPAANTLYIVIP